MKLAGQNLRFGLTVALVVTVSLLFAPTASAGDYPQRPITVIVPWGAGGGTDAVGRILSALLKEELGQPVNVVNRTGGSGVVGHSAIAYARPDGYTVGVATVELTMMHWLGLTQLTYREMTPIGEVNEDPAGLMVGADSRWKSAEELLAYVKAHPGELKGSGTGQGGIWHLALAGMLRAAGLEPNAVRWIPSRGAAPALQDLVAGGVDIVTASLPEGKSLIEAGRVRPLAVMSDARNEVFPDVPTLKEVTGLDWTTTAWRGLVAPRGTPEEIIAVLEKALRAAVNSKDYKKFLSRRGFGWKWLPSREFGALMARADASNGEIMKAAGIAH